MAEHSSQGFFLGGGAKKNKTHSLPHMTTVIKFTQEQGAAAEKILERIPLPKFVVEPAPKDEGGTPLLSVDPYKVDFEINKYKSGNGDWVFKVVLVVEDMGTFDAFSLPMGEAKYPKLYNYVAEKPDEKKGETSDPKKIKGTFQVTISDKVKDWLTIVSTRKTAYEMTLDNFHVNAKMGWSAINDNKPFEQAPVEEKVQTLRRLLVFTQSSNTGFKPGYRSHEKTGEWNVKGNTEPLIKVLKGKLSGRTPVLAKGTTDAAKAINAVLAKDKTLSFNFFVDAVQQKFEWRNDELVLVEQKVDYGLLEVEGGDDMQISVRFGAHGNESSLLGLQVIVVRVLVRCRPDKRAKFVSTPKVKNEPVPDELRAYMVAAKEAEKVAPKAVQPTDTSEDFIAAGKAKQLAAAAARRSPPPISDDDLAALEE